MRAGSGWGRLRAKPRPVLAFLYFAEMEEESMNKIGE